MFTVSHELVHFMRDFAPEQFDKFAGFLFASYAKKGLSVRHAVHQEMMAHQSLKYDEAYEEVVARLSESFLRDAHLSEKSKALYNADKSLWQSIKDGLEKVINKIKESFASISPESQLGKIGQKVVRENQEILDRFIAGVRAAADNSAYTENTTDEGGAMWMARETKIISDTVDTAISQKGQIGEKHNQKRICRVPSEIVDYVFSASGGKIDISKKYLAIEGAKIWHEYRNHSNPQIEQSRNQVALTPNSIKEAIRSFKKPYIVEAIYNDTNNPEQAKSFAIVSKSNNSSYVLIVEQVGGNRNPNVVPAMILEFTKSKLDTALKNGKSIAEIIYENDSKHLNAVTDNSQNIKNRVTVANTSNSMLKVPSPRSPLFNNSISQKPNNSNTSGKNNSTGMNQSRDADYLSAVDRGDMETAQRMVDEAAERTFADSKIRGEDGKLVKVYHGTYADFTVFDKAMGRSSADIQGMFFSPRDIDAGGYGPNVRAFYLNITNPADERTGYKALNAHKGENYVGIKAREDLEKAGYDGVNNSDEEYIAFTSEQIKSADPVTYDDKGKVIPLSQRFNSEKEDIRFDSRESDYADSYDYSKSFSEQIDDYKKGVFPEVDTLVVRDTPKVFKSIGLLPLPMTYTQKHLQEALDNKDGDHLGEKLIRKLPTALEKPIAIIDSISNPGRLVAIVDLPSQNNNTIAAIEVEGVGHLHGNKIDSNAITSAYTKKAAIENLLMKAVASEAIGSGGIYYWQKNKAIQLMKNRGVQFPKFNIADGSIRSITDPLSKVNTKMKSVTESKQFKRWFGDWQNKPQTINPVFMENGIPKVFYHGTPNGTFSVFKNWQYFTDNQEYANVYQNQGASSNGYKLTADKPYTYAVYLTGNHVFDTRNKKCRAIFMNEFYRKWGNGAPLSEKGLPDWTDGDDLVEFFEEKGYDYDVILLDEGATGGYGEKVQSRGISVVIKDSTQVKSATDNIGTYDRSNRDIRYDSRDGDLFEDDDLSFGEYDDISDVVKRQYTTHSEAIGEVIPLAERRRAVLPSFFA